MIHLALALVLAGPVPDSCPTPRPAELECAKKGNTFDAGICTVCTLRMEANARDAWLKEDTGLLELQQAALEASQVRATAAWGFGGVGAGLGATGAVLLADKHVAGGVAVLGVAALMEVAGLTEAGVIRF